MCSKVIRLSYHAIFVQAVIGSYIRLFEPLVIKALKQYTVTSCLQLQRQVLDLLTQLIQLRVNYCLLDSDMIFISFVLKQFEFIEEGQIRYRVLWLAKSAPSYFGSFQRGERFLEMNMNSLKKKDSFHLQCILVYYQRKCLRGEELEDNFACWSIEI